MACDIRVLLVDGDLLFACVPVLVCVSEECMYCKSDGVWGVTMS